MPFGHVTEGPTQSIHGLDELKIFSSAHIFMKITKKAKS